ncbi:MAG: heme o synthase [Terriglobia bacterium]
MSTPAYTPAAAPRAAVPWLADYIALTKPDVSLLVVLSALAGFYLASPARLDFALLAHTLLGTALVSAGTAAFNHFLERGDDARMRRTARRPLPAGRLEPGTAFVFAAALSLTGIGWLWLRVNLLASLLAFLTWASYLFLYTPLKKRTVWCTAVGAFPGAAPPLIGWAAAAGTLSFDAWVLFAIVFCWQFPHFLSIAWLYRDDYARAGVQMLPAVNPAGRATGQQVVFFTLALLPLGLLPVARGLTGAASLWGVLLLSLAFGWLAVRLARAPTTLNARRLLQASIVYLPLLLLLLMADKRPPG